MIGYRVTKYDPSHRDAAGAFLSEDWTSVSQIGRWIGGRTITKQEYLAVEDNYVEAAKQLLSGADIHSMRIMNLEIRTNGVDEQIGDGWAERCLNLRNDMIVAGKNLEGVIRGCLREYIWCRLSGAQKSYLHFGYDYYMYIGLPQPASAEAVPQGMFLEEVESPYMNIDD